MRWGTQLERGYTTLIAAKIYGIPARWNEREFMRVDTDGPPTETTHFTTSPSLVITPSSIIEWDIDRQTGIAAGRAFDIVLDLDAMGSEAELFRRPTMKARITADLTNPAATTINVDDTTGWPSEGLIYVGQECMYYGSKTGTSFATLTRAVAGDAHYHVSNGASGYAYATDRPVYWRGRYVELWEYLVAPDGRIVADAYEDADYAGVIWRGYIEAQPEVRSRQVTLRCLPLERRLDDELGTSATAKVAVPTVRTGVSGVRMPAGVYITETDKLIIIRESDGTSTQVPFAGPTGTVSLARWAQQALTDAATVFGGSFSGNIAPWAGQEEAPGFSWFAVAVPDGFRVESRAWFIGDMARHFDTSEGVSFEVYRGRLIPEEVDGAWLYIDVGLDVTGRPDAWPASGYGLLEVGSDAEIIAWDTVDSSLVAEGIVAIRLSQRGMVGTSRVYPWTLSQKVTLTALAGHIGSAEEVIRTLATSSGTGARGAYDTLPAGYGLGMRDAWLDVSAYPLTGLVLDGVAEAGSTVQELIGGWLALWQRCIIQTRDGADMVLRAVSSSVVDASNAPTVSDDDIILGSVEPVSVMESPNTVVVQRGVRETEAQLTIRDVPRVQAEGEQPWEIRAPGVTDAMAVGSAANLLRVSDGIGAWKFGVRPAFAAGPGDIVRVTAGHPEAYDWGTGAASTDVIALLTGYGRNLYTGETWRTALMPGQADALVPLCPSAQMLSRPTSDSCTISPEHLTGFAVGSSVLIYVAGEVDTLSTARTIILIAESGGNYLVQFNAAVSTSDYPIGSWFTFNVYGSNSEQNRHLYYDEGEFG